MKRKGRLVVTVIYGVGVWFRGIGIAVAGDGVFAAEGAISVGF